MCQVSVAARSKYGIVTYPLFFCQQALRGVGAHLLKVGSKRRRKQADIKGQNEREELSQVQFEEQSQRIAELEAQLNNVQLERDSNVAAAEILTQMIRTGDAE